MVVGIWQGRAPEVDHACVAGELVHVLGAEAPQRLAPTKRPHAAPIKGVILLEDLLHGRQLHGRDLKEFDTPARDRGVTNRRLMMVTEVFQRPIGVPVRQRPFRHNAGPGDDGLHGGGFSRDRGLVHINDQMLFCARDRGLIKNANKAGVRPTRMAGLSATRMDGLSATRLRKFFDVARTYDVIN